MQRLVVVVMVAIGFVFGGGLVQFVEVSFVYRRIEKFEVGSFGNFLFCTEISRPQETWWKSKGQGGSNAEPGMV
jgi:hypothetical protein